MRVHKFAVEMINWLGCAQKEFGICTEANPPAFQFNPECVDKNMAFIFYHARAKKVKGDRIIIRKLNSRTDEMQTLNTLIPLHLEETRTRNENAYSEHGENLLNLFNSIKSIYTARFNYLNGKIDDQSYEIVMLKKRIEQCEIAIQKVKSDLKCARQETQNVRSELSRLANEPGGGGCSIQ